MPKIALQHLQLKREILLYFESLMFFGSIRDNGR